MGAFQQLKGMLKSEYIQMKRNKFLSFIEIFFPPILLLLFLFIRLLFKTEKEKYDDIYQNDLEFILHNSSNLTNHIKSKEDQKIPETINEKDVPDIPLPYNYFLLQCKMINHIAIIGKDFPQGLIDKISSHLWELDNDYPNDIFKKFESVEDFNEYISSKDYGKNEEFPKICFGISKTDKFKYGIHYNTITIDNEDKSELEELINLESPLVPDTKSNKNDKIRVQENFKFFNYYQRSGYLMTMKLIYDYMLQEITSDPNAEINFSIVAMKYDEVLHDSFHRFLNLLGFFVIISYSIPFSINIYKEVHLRETKKKEYLKCMGMKDSIFFMSSFIKYFIINLFHSIFCSLFVKLILKQSQYGYLFCIFLLFGLVIFSMIYFFQSFLQEARIGVIISLVLFCIMSFFYLPINSPEANKGFTYFICIIFPQTNLLLGFNTLYVFEKEFSSLNNRVNLDVSQITTSLMIVFLLISIILYLVLGYFISQIFCYEYGINNGLCCTKKKHIINIEKNKIYINNDNENEKTNNTQYSSNRHKSRDKSNSKSFSSKYSNRNRKGNPPKKDDDFSNLGNQYIDDDEDEKDYNGKVNNEKYIKKVKIGFMDYVESKSKKMPKEILQKKLENLKKSMWKLGKNKIQNTDESNPHFLDDECEIDLDNQVEMQEIRNLRRTQLGTMYNLKSDEDYLNEDLKLSVINHAIPGEFLTKSLASNILLDETKNDNVSKDQTTEKQDYIYTEEKSKFKKDEIKEKKESLKFCQRLEISNLRKKYENKKVLDNFSFKAYENEIFALLGQNGAGKSTFISILNGLIEADDGGIKYFISNDKNEFGSQVLDKYGNTNFREYLGFCPQNNNILFDDLTIEENLEIFCLLKYDSRKNGNNEKDFIRKEVTKLINDFDFNESKTKLVKNLSGGLKRRLAIAIASCGKSKIIVLDEPTGGIDILSMKKIWDILLTLKSKKIIILITHFMEEASYLADQIGVLKDGKIICRGSNKYLIDRYGKYITIQINRKKDDNYKNLIYFIKDNFLLSKENQIDSKSYSSDSNSSYSNGNNLIDGTSISSRNSDKYLKVDQKFEIKVFKERIVIKIPTRLFNFSNLEKKLKTMEEEYKVDNYRIVKEQLNDAFINIMKDEAKKDDRRGYLTLLEIDRYIIKLYGFEKFKNELKLLIKKRFYETLKDKKSFILEILFPILLTFIACLVSYIEILENNKSSLIELNTYNNDTQIIYYEALDHNDYYTLNNILSSTSTIEERRKFKHFHSEVLPTGKEDKNFNLLKNITAYFMTLYKYHEINDTYNNYASFYLISANKISHKYEFVSYYSAKQRHSAITYTNYLLQNIIKYEIKNPNNNENYKSYVNSVSITNSPFPLSYEEKNDKKSRNGFVLAFFISIALALIPSNFITIIIREKENKSKHLQLLSGLSIYTYWINNFIFEIIKYYIVVGICLILLACFSFYEKYLAVLYIFYGPALVAFTYFLSHFLNTEGSAQITILLINLFFGSLCGSAVLILRTNENLKNFGIFLSIIFRVVPSFCICYGYNQLMSKKALFAIDYYDKNDKDFEKIKKKYDDPSNIIKDPNYISIDIIFLVLEMFIYICLLIFFENKDYFLRKLGLKKQNNINNYERELKTNNLNNKVDIKENIDKYYRQTSKRDIANKEEKNYSLEVNGLNKIFYDKKDFFNKCKKRKKVFELKNINFKVRNGSCYGLLGGNSSGKSTTFRCLCKEIEPNKGTVKLNNIDIFNYSQNDRINIGYCPQFDSIFEYLTVKQNLIFYGTLKQINKYRLNEIVNIIIEKLNLTEFKNKISKNLSGGNKRKLSVGISLISKPNIIFLDEPSTGMDPYTRISLVDILHKAYLKDSADEDKSKRSIVLTTHSIEEAEVLCDEICILNNGEISPNGKGKISELLQRESKGIELNVEFKKPSQKEIQNKYGDILSEKIYSKEELKQFLYYIKKGNYYDYIKPNSLGKDILNLLKKKKSANKYTILRWVEYMDYLSGLASKIKKYFENVTCMKYKLNNCILKVYNYDYQNKKSIKCESHIFGIIEGCKKELSIDEYNYNLTTLENIFIKCSDNSNKINGKDSMDDTESGIQL